MSDIQRYSIDAVEGNDRSGYPEAKLEIERHDFGEWVRYEDYRARADRLEKLLRCAKVYFALHKNMPNDWIALEASIDRELGGGGG